MRFLIDENLSWRLTELLTKAGHDAIHLRDLDATGAPDTDVVALATRDERIIVSADTDFGPGAATSGSDVHGRGQPWVKRSGGRIRQTRIRPLTCSFTVGTTGFEPATP